MAYFTNRAVVDGVANAPLRIRWLDWATGSLAIAASRDVLSEFPDVRLTRAEERRADRKSSALDREDFVAAHILVRVAAARMLRAEAVDLSLRQHCRTCGGDHGRPEIVEAAELGVSLSHGRGYVAAAAGPGAVGVDVERVGRHTQLRAGWKRALTYRELQALAHAPDPRATFLQIWTRKEAMIKACQATMASMREIETVGAAGDFLNRIGTFMIVTRCAASWVVALASEDFGEASSAS